MSRRSRLSQRLALTASNQTRGAGVREYLKFFCLSAATCLGGICLHRLAFAWGKPSAWIFVELLFEVSLALGLYSFCGSLRTVLLAQFALGGLFRVLNSIKLYFLDVVILPSDFLLINDLRLLLGAFKFWLIMGGISAVIAGLSALVWKSRRKAIKWRSWGFLPAVFWLGWVVAFPKGYYCFFDWMLQGEQIGKPFHLTLREAEMGVPVTFTTQFARYLAHHRSVPARNVVKSTLREVSLSADPKAMVPAVPPQRPSRNVYVILTETFWDPSSLWPDRGIDNYLDPDFQKLWVFNGHRWMLPPVFGGSTANTEFELLCGIPARSVSDGIVFQSALVNRLACLPDLLRQQGYRTFAFHPFSPGFFNRTGAFQLIGFEHFFSLKDFAGLVVPGFPIVPDVDFMRESAARARTEAGGKPFLAYMMTFAGHWPFYWVPDLYAWMVHIPGANANEQLATLERHLNINRIASAALATTVRNVFLADPTALIVISGDHLPGLAKNGSSSGFEQPERKVLYFQTPVLILNGQEGPPLERNLTAFEIPNEILRDLGVQKQNRGFLPWFELPPGPIIRPIPSGELLIVDQKGVPPVSCGSGSGPEAPSCTQAEKWFEQARILGRDLVFGSQYSKE